MRRLARVLLAASLTFFTTGLFSKEPIFPPGLKESEFKRMQEFYRALDAGLVPTLDAVAEETKAEPPTRNLTDADEKSIQEIFPRIFFVDAASRGSLDIQAPVFVIPNGNLARITSSWNRVLLHGKNILRKPTADEIEEDTTFRRVDQVDAGNFRTIIRT